MNPLCCGFIKQGIQTMYLIYPDRVERIVARITRPGSPGPGTERRKELEQYRANA